MELISNLFQFAVTLLGFCMSGIRYLKGRKQTYFLLTCFYGCFALGSLYWTLYLLLFSETPQVFYVSEFGWIASVIFLYLLQCFCAFFPPVNYLSFLERVAGIEPARSGRKHDILPLNYTRKYDIIITSIYNRYQVFNKKEV